MVGGCDRQDQPDSNTVLALSDDRENGQWACLVDSHADPTKQAQQGLPMEQKRGAMCVCVREGGKERP